MTDNLPSNEQCLEGKRSGYPVEKPILTYMQPHCGHAIVTPATFLIVVEKAMAVMILTLAVYVELQVQSRLLSRHHVVWRIETLMMYCDHPGCI